MTKVSIEEMTERDLEATVAIDLASFHPRGDDVERGAARAARLREELARPWARAWIARDRREVIGYVLFWHVVDELHLLEVAVAPASRRSGVGRALVSAVVAYGRARAAAKILLEVRASNIAALTLYEQLGFRRFNVRARYYADGEDGVEMVLELPAPSPPG